MKVKVTQLCLTLRNPMEYTINGILQARILEWVAFPFSRGSSQPKDRTQVPCIAGRFFTVWATREAIYKWYYVVFACLCLTYFTQCNSLGPSVLLQMALFFNYYLFIPQ